MIHTRIHIKTERPAEGDLDVQDAYNAAVMGEILAGARVAAEIHGTDVVRVEVAYPRENWAESGDALEIDLSGDEPQFTTLPPYSEVTA